MSIKGKTGLILLAFFILYSLISYGIQSAAIFESFQSLEDKEARKNLFRSLDAISTEIDRIASLCQDWAAIYKVFKTSAATPELFFKSSFSETVFAMNRINMVIFCNEEGETIWGASYDLLTEEQMPLTDALIHTVKTTSPILTYDPDGLMLSESGVIAAEPYPILVSSHPIIKGNHEEEIEGYLIFGRFLTADLVEEFSDQSEFEFELIPLREENLAPDLMEIANRLTPDNQQLINTDHEAFLYAYTTALDINGEKAFLVRSKIPRDFLKAGKRVMGYAFLSTILAGIFMFFGLRFILQRVILSPVSNLTNQMVLVGKTGDLTSRQSVVRRDEIGVLAKEFEGMLEKLAEKDNALVAANSRLEQDIKERQRLIDELEKALSEVKTLSGMLPICAQCKKIRDDKGYWNQIESYIGKHSEAQFSHGICPDCAKKLYPDLYEEIERMNKSNQSNHGES